MKFIIQIIESILADGLNILDDTITVPECKRD